MSVGSAPPARVTAAVVDDHVAIREGVRAGLEARGVVRVVAGASTVDEFLRDAPPTAVDVVLLDIQLHDGSSPADNVARLLARGCDVLVYSAIGRPADLRAAVAAGALGAVGKGQGMAELEEAILGAAKGEPLLTTEWAAALDSAPCEGRPQLSEREAEALGLYAMGLEMKSAARRMGISLGTFKEYLLRVRRKYSEVDRPAGTKLDLYHRAVEDGYVSAGARRPR